MAALNPLTSFIADFYIDIAPRYKAYLQDIGPYLPNSECLANALFPWEELAQKSLEAKSSEEFEVDIRVADKESNLRPRKDFATQFPVELQSMAEL